MIPGCASGLTDPDSKAEKGSPMGAQLDLMIHDGPQDLIEKGEYVPETGIAVPSTHIYLLISLIHS